MKRNILILFFISCFLLPYLGSYVWLNHHRKIIRKEVKRKMKQGLEKTQLVFFKFSKQDAQSKLKWEHAKEFEFNGEMYDIIETSITNDSIEYWCWHDKEETILNKQLSTLTTQAIQTNKPYKQKQQRVAEFFKKIVVNTAFMIDQFSCQSVHILYAQIICDYSSPIIEGAKKPPQLT